MSEMNQNPTNVPESPLSGSCHDDPVSVHRGNSAHEAVWEKLLHFVSQRNL